MAETGRLIDWSQNGFCVSKRQILYVGFRLLVALLTELQRDNSAAKISSI
jgi:hypothetical protein